MIETNRAAGAEVEVDAVFPPFAELDDRLLRAGGEAIVAFEAVATGEAAIGLVARLFLGDPRNDLGKAQPRRRRQFARLRPSGIEKERQVEVAERDRRRFRRRIIGLATQPGIDGPRRLLAVAGRRRHGADAADHIAAGEEFRAGRSSALRRP